MNSDKKNILDSIDYLIDNKRNSTSLAVIKSSLLKGNLSHAYLFCGDNIEFLEKLALSFAASVNCNYKGCGNCNICKSTLKGIFQNLTIIEPDGNILTIDKIIQLQRFMSISSYLPGKKVCIIKEAELMNREASNRLLKTLEDPPDNNCLFILLSEDINSILPTIVSRCVVFEWDFTKSCNSNLFLDVKLLREIVDNGMKEIINSFASSKNKNNFNQVLRISMKILDYLKRNILLDEDEIKAEMAKIKSIGTSASEIKKFEENLRTKSRRKQNKYYQLGMELVFDIISAWLEDILLVRTGADFSVLNNSLNYEILNNNVSFIKVEKLLKLIDTIEKNREYLKYSIYAEIALDNIFLQLLNLN